MQAFLETPVSRRAFHLAGCLAALALGLASRRHAWLAPLLGKYPGDALWAAMVFFGFGVLRPMGSVRWLAVAAGAFSFVIEVLKLSSAPWLVYLRQSRYGYLVFGHAFSFENLVAYAVGIAIAAGVAFVCVGRARPAASGRLPRA